MQDLGTGIGTVLAQVVAEELGLQPDDITVLHRRHRFSRRAAVAWQPTTASITPPARTAAWKVKQMLFRQVAPTLGTTPDQLVGTRRPHHRSATTRARSACATPRRACAPIRLSAIESRADDYGGFRRRMGDANAAQQRHRRRAVRRGVGRYRDRAIRVERVVAVQDCGRPMNPKLIESQVQGGVLMGICYALLEQRIIDQHTGRMVNANLEQYKIVGPRETPPIEVVLLENYQGQSATDAYGIAEPSNIATAPAIANAVYNAIGVRLRELPMTPAVVLTALGKLPVRS